MATLFFSRSLRS